MISITAAAFVALAAAAAPPAGRLEGQVTFSAAPRRDLSNVVVHLVPRGHEIKPTPSAKPVVVSQKDAKFRPDILAVVKGQTVSFVNDDAIDHNVFSYSDASSFDLGVYAKGVSKSVTFDKEGPVEVHCSIHQWMNGVVFVAPNRYFALTDKKGGFVIDGIPPGIYEARAWNPSLPLGRAPIEMKGSSRLVIDLGASEPR
jgi:plastocyanin